MVEYPNLDSHGTPCFTPSQTFHTGRLHQKHVLYKCGTHLACDKELHPRTVDLSLWRLEGRRACTAGGAPRGAMLTDAVVGNLEQHLCIVLPLVKGLGELPSQDIARLQVPVNDIL